MIKRIALVTIFSATLFTSPINAGDVDCDAMVEECIDKNPYFLVLTPGKFLAYNSGCSQAGAICESMQG